MGRSYSFSEDKLIGFIETVAIDEAGRCWVSGWSFDSVGDIFGLVLIDRKKYPGAMLLARFDRGDLPDGASGFIGLINSEWRPDILTKNVIIILSSEDMSFLRSGGEILRRVSIREMATMIELARVQGGRAHFDEIRDLLVSPESWVPGLARAVSIPVDISFDSIILMPGVGCVIEGWALSPIFPIVDFALRVGDIIYRVDWKSSYRRVRHDLATAFPKYAELCGNAGLVLFFPIENEDIISHDMTLKAYHYGNDTTNYSINDSDILWLNNGSGEAALIRCYPSLECEPFFQKLAYNLQKWRLTNPRMPVGWNAHKAKYLLIIGISDISSDAYVAIDNIIKLKQILNLLNINIAIVSNVSVRSDIIPLYMQLELIGINCASLFFVESTIRPSDINNILFKTSAEAFIFLREGYRAGINDMKKCLFYLFDNLTEPAHLEINDDISLSRLNGHPLLLYNANEFAEIADMGMNWPDIPAGRSLGEAFRIRRYKRLRPLENIFERAGVSL